MAVQRDIDVVVVSRGAYEDRRMHGALIGLQIRLCDAVPPVCLWHGNPTFASARGDTTKTSLLFDVQQRAPPPAHTIDRWQSASMAFQTPRRLNPPRPPLNSTASSPALFLNASTASARKASLNALTGGASPPAADMGADSLDIDVGDAVDVPGGMHGVVKFVGSIRGKKGVFAGVELSREFASRGKNNGDVEGTRYFTASVPGSGIFLPIHRASKRSSASSDEFLPTPTTPSYANFSLSTNAKPTFSPGTPAIPKFSQSVGPGAGTSPRRGTSLSRPESPYRRTPSAAHTPGKTGGLTPSGFSKSAIGAPPRFSSPAPPPRIAGLQKPRTPGPQGPYSRNNSRLATHDTIDEDGESTPSGAARSSNDSMASFKGRRVASRAGSHQAGTQQADEVQRLKQLLEERDKQLKDQATSLSEMEASLSEIQTLFPEDGMDLFPTRSNGAEAHDVGQLRILLKEKNEKISMLTAEFDAHRADFRSTIDTLELASTETERVYEKKVEELQEELREYQSRTEDVETVAMQLKQLEELVQELEEGLEDARRGEAEARGEVEFLRGEVERGRSELRREREKAAAALKGASVISDSSHTSGQREVEQRDDEIRGLKAIIHSLSSGAQEERSRSPPSRQNSSVDPEELKTAQAVAERLEREKEDLRGLVERKAYREEELEREVEKLKSQLGLAEQRASVISHGVSEHTTTQEQRPSERDSKGTVVSWRETPPLPRRDPPALEPMSESDGRSSAAESALWCDICETGGHDILNCSAMGADATYKEEPIVNSPDLLVEGLRNLSVSSGPRPAGLTPSKPSGSAPTAPLPMPAFNNSNTLLVPPKGAAIADPDKWCALCENEGHDVTECPNEDAF